MVAIIEMVYKIAKGYMVKKINDTENAEFISRFNEAFKTIEEIWASVKSNVPTNKQDEEKKG